MGKAPPITVKTVTLRPEKVQVSRQFCATITAGQTVDLAFSIDGRICQLYQVQTPDGPRDVQEGDQLGKGTILAKLDNDDSIRRRDLAKAGWERAGQMLKRAKAVLAMTQTEYDRIKNMAETTPATQETQAATQESHGGIQEELADAKARLEVAEIDKTIAEKDEQAAKLLLEQAEARLAEAVLRVPIDNAIVSLRKIQTGQVVSAGAVAFQIMDVAAVDAVFGVSDTMLPDAAAIQPVPQVAIGQKLTLLAEAFPGHAFEGQVTRIAPMADPVDGTFQTRVRVKNIDGKLKPGMVATITVSADRENLLLAPISAVQRGASPSQAVVYVLAGDSGRNIVRRRQVNLGAIYADRVEILAGSEVRAGDRIVSVGAIPVEDGQEVSVLAAGQASTQP